jgi:hypothetical protein
MAWRRRRGGRCSKQPELQWAGILLVDQNNHVVDALTSMAHPLPNMEVPEAENDLSRSRIVFSGHIITLARHGKQNGRPDLTTAMIWCVSLASPLPPVFRDDHADARPGRSAGREARCTSTRKSDRRSRPQCRSCSLPREPMRSALPQYMTMQPAQVFGSHSTGPTGSTRRSTATGCWHVRLAIGDDAGGDLYTIQKAAATTIPPVFSAASAGGRGCPSAR